MSHAEDSFACIKLRRLSPGLNLIGTRLQIGLRDDVFS